MKSTATKLLIMSLALLAGTFCSTIFAEGDITVDVDPSGNLEIVGDNNSDQGVMISGAGFPGGFRVTATDGDTLINGLPEIIFAGVTGDVTVNMKSGNKLVLVIEGDSPTLEIDGDLEIKNTGSSDFGLIMRGVVVAGKFDLRTKGGDDVALIAGTEIGGRTRLNTSGGNDALVTAFSGFSDRLEVRTAGGADHFFSVFNGALDRVDIRAGGQSDNIGMASSLLPDLSVNGNGGSDSLLLEDVDTLSYTERSIESTYAGTFVDMLDDAQATHPHLADMLFLFSLI